MENRAFRASVSRALAAPLIILALLAVYAAFPPAAASAGGEAERPANPWQGKARAGSGGEAGGASPAVSGTKPARAAGTGVERVKQGKILLNFIDADLKDMIKTISAITGENFIVSPGLAAKISIQTAKPVGKEDVLGIFESVLEVNRLAAVKEGEYYKIVPAPSARQLGVGLMSGRDPDKVPGGEGFINLVAPVEFISAGELMQILKPLLSPSGNIASHPGSNSLIVTDLASNIRKTLEIVAALDVEPFGRMNIALAPLSNTDSRTMEKELREILGAMGFTKDSPQVSILSVERLNSLILMAQSRELMESVKLWIGRLDTVSETEGASMHVYYVKNDKASNIKNIIDQMLGDGKALKGGGAPAAEPAGDKDKAPGGPPSRAYGNPSGGGAGMRVYLYEPTNALIIHSSHREYQMLLNTLAELDRPPKQALIDAMVMEITLDESTRQGIQWSALAGNVSIQQNTGIVPGTLNSPKGPLSSPAGVAAPSGLSVFATDASKFFNLVQALASEGKVKVLSNPHIMVKNYEKASITVGSDEPIATQSTQTAVTGTASLIQNIEYRKTGIILSVTPQITEGGMVAMTIRQEISDISTSRVVGSGTFPSFTKREAETSVVAKDRETIVIGGLIEEKNDVSENGIPFLMHIPLLGNLFKFKTVDNGKTELVILLTPSVISDSGQAASVTGELKRKLEGLSEFLKDRGQ